MNFFMKLNFKLFFVLVVIIVLVCFFMINHMKNKNEGKITTTQIANPMKKSTPQEIINTIGVKFNEPKNVTEINYFIISNQVAQMNFIKDGISFTARIKPANQFEDISGMYFNWNNEQDCKIAWCSGKIYFMNDAENKNPGICIWYDVAPGLMYSLSMDDKSNPKILLNLANEIYHKSQE